MRQLGVAIRDVRSFLCKGLNDIAQSGKTFVDGLRLFESVTGAVCSPHSFRTGKVDKVQFS